MSEQLQLRNGTSAQCVAFTGAVAECAIDTTNNRIVVNDGSTIGGWPAAKLSETLTNTRASVSDAAYSLTAAANSYTPWVTMIAYTALTAARVVSLPAASAFPTGTRLLVIDETGNATSILTITVTPNGTNTINGVNGSVVINTAYGYIGLESNGSSGWTMVDQGNVPATKTLAELAHGALVGINIIEATVTLSGASTNVSTQIPANSIVFAVSERVTTTVTAGSGTLTGFEIGVSGNLSQFGSALGLAAGDTNYGLIGPTAFYSATTIVVTAQGSGSPTFGAGALRLSIVYLSFSPPTS